MRSAGTRAVDARRPERRDGERLVGLLGGGAIAVGVIDAVVTLVVDARAHAALAHLATREGLERRTSVSGATQRQPTA